MIKEKLRKVFLKDPSKPLFWILLGVLVKGIPFLFLLHSRPPSDIPGIWAATMGDTHNYIDPVDNLLHNGIYSPDFRMPGYPFIYFLFRLLFSKVFACNILVVFQYLLAGISVYCLASAAGIIFNSVRLFYVCFYLYLISGYSNYLDGWLMTESLGCTTLIFTVWYMARYFQSGRVANLLLSGFFHTWAIFLRPVFAPLIFVFLLIVVFQELQGSPSINRRKKDYMFRAWRSGALFILPFLLCDGAWTSYNYIKHQRVIILARGVWVPEGDTTYIKPLYEFMTSWGGSADFTDSTSYATWFGFHFKDSPIRKNYSAQFPNEIFTSQFNKDSLLKLKRMITALNDSTLLPKRASLYQQESREKLMRYTLSVRNEHPLLYYIKAPLFHSLPRFLFGQESKIYNKRFNLPGKWGFLSQAFFLLFYYVMLILGIVGAFFILFQRFRDNKLKFIIAFIPLYTIIIHPLVLRLSFNRYMLPCWTFLLVCAAYVIVKGYERIKLNAPFRQ